MNDQKAVTEVIVKETGVYYFPARIIWEYAMGGWAPMPLLVQINAILTFDRFYRVMCPGCRKYFSSTGMLRHRPIRNMAICVECSSLNREEAERMIVLLLTS
jgi:hypothetical protein